jgi:ParB family transcriptional regulator, chromosome partitioning protein
MPEITMQEIPVKKIFDNKLNPRLEIGDTSDLRKSIIQQGLIQPVRVRPVNNKFELVAGHRRILAINDAINKGELPKNYKVPAIIEVLDDAQTMQMMFAENLMRADLSDYEQAKSFKDYLDKFNDPKTLEDLSEKTGINIQYIRRRAKIFDLPDAVIDLWKADKLSYGHLEQLMRIDPEQVVETAQQTVKYGWTVKYLKDEVERSRAILNNALFDIKAAGCNTCQFSTKVQKSLFGDDFKMAKVTCTNPKCYYGKQTEYINTNWQSLPVVKKHKTNGILISSYGNQNQVMSIHGVTDAKCAKCENYISQVMPDGTTFYDKACKGNKFCHSGIYYPNIKSSQHVLTPDEKKEVKAENLGKEFAEVFYKEKMPEVINQAKLDDTRINTIIAYSVAKMFRSHVHKLTSHDENCSVDDFIQSIPTMDDAEVKKFYKNITSHLLFDDRVFDLHTRKTVAEQFDIRLDRDFVMNEDYLSKKTKAQLIELGNKFSLFGGSEDEIADMKKTELIEQILNNDLSGIIPDEIKKITEVNA